MYVDVRAGDRVRAGDERRGEPPARTQQAGQLLGVAREVQHGVDPVGRDGAYLGLQVGGVVDRIHLRPGQSQDEAGFGAGARGGDHPYASTGGELNRQRAHPACRARDQQRLPRRRVHRGDGVQRRRPGEAQRAGVRHRQTGGDRRDAGTGRYGHVLRHRAGAQERLTRHAENRVADGEPEYAVANRLDGPGEVHPDHQREPMFHHSLQIPGGRGGIEPVHRRGRDLHQQLARDRARAFHLADRGGRVGGVEEYGAHVHHLS